MRAFILIGLLLTACATDSATYEPDASLDATAAPDAAPRMCPQETTGVLIGDSIVAIMYRDAFEVLTEGDNVVYSQAVSGQKILQQVTAWETSPWRGSEKIDWIFVQVGINDLVQGSTPEQMLADMTRLSQELEIDNPGAVVFLGKMLPARLYIGSTRYPTWLAATALLAENLPMENEVSDGMNNGNDYLILSNDGLHPVAEGSKVEAALLRSWVKRTFPDQPCE